ncbi:MAPK/MAK/MRK overlapping kinase isoform X11 [Cavia porcellus]|uniref:MAPK/MAK/MRK overlapping kinase isoform X11 n=1 Tax=Cavia porcellus TaxID=10141 RepID=UPI002FE24669
MKNYKAIGKIGEGTFSEVLKMQSLRDGGFYACKQMKQHFDSVEQVNNLREIQALRRLNPHPNILTLHEVVFDRKSGSLALICELMDMNIYELIRGRRRPLSERKIMLYMYQLCKSLDHMHRNGMFHRDVKPENILIKQDVLKLGDFGSCRSVYSRQPYTEYISTRWYRAPECLLTDGFYTSKMDMWSAGCVFYEIARASEKQAWGSRSHTTFSGHMEPLGHKWQIPEGNKQAPRRREVPARLPKLPLPAVSALPVRSSPALRALKFGGTCDKVNTQDTKPDPPLCRLPKIDQKGARY